MLEKKYRCPECGKMRSEYEGCVCRDCAAILTQDANREMFGEDEAAYLEAAGIDNIGDK
jgi:hypothetical protein